MVIFGYHVLIFWGVDHSRCDLWFWSQYLHQETETTMLQISPPLVNIGKIEKTTKWFDHRIQGFYREHTNQQLSFQWISKSRSKKTSSYLWQIRFPNLNSECSTTQQSVYDFRVRGRWLLGPRIKKRNSKWLGFENFLRWHVPTSKHQLKKELWHNGMMIPNL